MSEFGRYDRGSSTISRQFTDSEMAVNDRMSEYLTQEVDSLPPARLQGGYGAQQAYAWLEQDLKRRDEATRRLGAEFDLATRQSARQKLAEDAEADTIRKEQAATGIRRVSNWANERTEDGKPKYNNFNEAMQSFVEENPDSIANPDFIEGVKSLAAFSKSDEEREIDQIKQSVNKSQLLFSKEEIDSTMAIYADNPGMRKDMLTDLLKTKEYEAQIGVQRAELDAAAYKMAYDESKEALSVVGTLLKDPANADNEVAVISVFKQSGFNLSNPTAVVNEFGPNDPSMRMLTNRAFINNTKVKNPEAMAALQASLDVIQNPESNATDKFKAKAQIKTLAAEYYTYEEQARVVDQNNKAINSISSEMPKLRKNLQDSNKSLLELSVERWKAGKDESGRSKLNFWEENAALIENYKSFVKEAELNARGAGLEAVDAKPILSELDALMDSGGKDGKRNGEYTIRTDAKAKRIAEKYMTDLIESTKLKPATPKTVNQPLGNSDLDKSKDSTKEEPKANLGPIPTETFRSTYSEIKAQSPDLTPEQVRTAATKALLEQGYSLQKTTQK